MSDLFPVSLDDMLAETEREIRFRQSVYPRTVLRREMRQTEADRHLQVMQTVRDFLKLVKNGPSDETLTSIAGEELDAEALARLRDAWSRMMRRAITAATTRKKDPQNGHK